jgi:hypothetical protein
MLHMFFAGCERRRRLVLQSQLPQGELQPGGNLHAGRHGLPTC